MIVEAVCYNTESVLSAYNCGVQRIELCSSPESGGLTPSYGLILRAKKIVGGTIPIYVMIRPREGDFIYSQQELLTMMEDINMCATTEVSGVVFGVLTKKGEVDVKSCKQLMEETGFLKTTFHRAFDMTNNLENSFYKCRDCGFDFILTSGKQNTAFEGCDSIAQLVNLAHNEDINIIAGGGVTKDNILPIIQRTKVKYVHLSAKMEKKSPAENQINSLSLGKNYSPYSWQGIDEQELESVLSLVK